MHKMSMLTIPIILWIDISIKMSEFNVDFVIFKTRSRLDQPVAYIMIVVWLWIV